MGEDAVAGNSPSPVMIRHFPASLGGKGSPILWRRRRGLLLTLSDCNICHASKFPSHRLSRPGL